MNTASHRPSTVGLSLHELVRDVPCHVVEGAGATVGGADAIDQTGPLAEGGVGTGPTPVIFGVSLDSRSVVAGDLYAALPGEHHHGAEFAAQAADRGAVAVLTDPQGAEHLDTALPVVVALSPRAVLGEVAARIYGRPSSGLRMLGITGTNGKTTTAYLLESALRAHGCRTGLIGTVETRLGDEVVEAQRTTPEATDLHALLAVMLERGLDTCVMEVSSHALTLHRVDGVRFDVALFTNLSQDHLDFHDDMDDYFQAKASLFTPARSNAAVIVVDDEWGARLAAETTLPVTTLSARRPGVPTADWSVLEPDDDGGFTLSGPADARLRLRSHLPGTFNVANTALAALALLQLGLDRDEVELAMAVPPDVPGRMQVVAPGRAASQAGPGAPRCIVDFAHSPDAVEAALLAVRPSTHGRLVVVLGAGGDRDRGKRQAMGAAAARNADVVVVTDDNPRSEQPADIRRALLDGARAAVASAPPGRGAAARLIEVGGRAHAIEAALVAADVDGTVLLLGKGHEKGQEIAGVVHPFDDRDAVLAALSASTTGGSEPGPDPVPEPGPAPSPPPGQPR